MKLTVKQGATNHSIKDFNKVSSKQTDYSIIEKKFREGEQKIIEKSQIVLATCKQCEFNTNCILQEWLRRYQNVSQKTG